MRRALKLAMAIKGAMAARSIIDAPSEPEQVIEPFAVGTLSFVGASIDEQSFENGNTAATADAVAILAAYGLTSAVREDAASGRDMAGLVSALPAIITTVSALSNPVMVFANILGNDVSGAVGTYGRADNSPPGFWETRISQLDSCIQSCRAAGIRPIVTNTSWRNYGNDNSCRTDEDKGSRWVDETHLHPYIRANLPECWDFSEERPLIDCYRGSWHIADWGYADSVHPNELGKIFWRRFVTERVAMLATGVRPAPITQQPWPFVAASSARQPLRVAFSTPGATGLPTEVNKFGRTGAQPGTLQPLTYIDGSPSPHWVHISHNTGSFTARGNAGDVSGDITDDDVLKYSVSSNSRICLAIGGFNPLEAVRLRYTASSTFSAAAGDKVTEVNVPFAAPQSIETDLAPTNSVLSFDTMTDGAGVVYVALTRPSGSTSCHVSGIEVEGRAA